MKVFEYKDREKFLEAVVSEIRQLHSGNILLSGGSTRVVYERLSEMIADRDFQFYQLDERYVSRDHSDSNYRMIAEAGLKVQGFDTSLSIADCLEKYKAEIADQKFDLAILGIGPDGHIASLFPGVVGADRVLHTQTDTFTVRDRLTLGWQPILDTEKIIITLNGKSKQAVLDELLQGTKNETEFPAKKLLSHPNLFIYFYNQ